MKMLVYPDFKEASERNLMVCKKLLELLTSVEQFNKKLEILHKVYYLGGYIIEFCYKYALFSHISIQDTNLNKTTNLNEYKEEVKFPKQWKIHKFDILENICSKHDLQFSSDIPFLGQTNCKELNKLKMRWNTEIRYSLKLANQEIELNEKNIKLFLDKIEEMFIEVNKKYN